MTDLRAWRRVGCLLFAVGWGANHFAALLRVYRLRLGLDAAAPALLFGMYALGLVPGLLWAGPLSDRHGRRAIVLPSAALVLASSVVLGCCGAWFGALLAGRLLYGIGAGGVMSAGAAWLVELSEQAAPGTGPRRATIALSGGFGLGPLVSGLLAQYVPYPTVLPYVVHVALLAVALLVARPVPEVRAPSRDAPRDSTQPLLRIELEAGGWSKFLGSIAPMAPFVFAFPAIAFAALPSLLEGALGRAPLAYTGLLCAVTLTAGILAQPLTRRFEPNVASRLGLAVGAAGLALGAWAVAAHATALLLVVAAILGAAYGVCMTAGLQGVQRLARPNARGGITGLYYVLTYIGFAAPYGIALAARVLAPVPALGLTAAIATAAALLLRRP